MSRLIIFGATGNLGSHVLRQASAAGHEVTAVVRNPSRLAPQDSARISVHRGDLATLAPADLAYSSAGTTPSSAARASSPKVRSS